jgi:hypothetical protein
LALGVQCRASAANPAWYACCYPEASNHNQGEDTMSKKWILAGVLMLGGCGGSEGNVGHTVTGKIVFDPVPSGWSGAPVHVSVRDASVLCAGIMPGCTGPAIGSLELAASGPDLTFQIDHLKPDPNGYYAVAVWVDEDRSGSSNVGDYVTVATYPVLTRGHPNDVEVTVKPVD